MIECRGMTRRAVPLTLTVLVAAIAASTTALAAPKPTNESYAALKKQIAAKKIQKATVSPQKHTVKVKLANGKTYAATFTATQQAALVSALKAENAKVHVDKKAKKKAGHIRYRYVALIVIAVLAILGGAYWLVRRRRNSGSHSPTVIEPGPSST